MKQQHATFILEMIKHGDKLRAYRAAYPKAKGLSAQKSAERLLRQTHIANEIQAVVRDIRSQTVFETYKVMQQEQHVRILSVMKKREILNQIATCEMKVGRYIKDEDGYRIVYEDPRPRDIIKAIEVDTKLEEACNRMRDTSNIELSRFDIYIDGRPCDDPNAPVNPDIPTGLIMLPRKKQSKQEAPAQNNFPLAEVGSLPQENSLVPSPLKGDRGKTLVPENPLVPSTRNDIPLEREGDRGKLFSHENDYLTLKSEALTEKRQRTENDPVSESFYKGFVRQREAAPPPRVMTDEEIERFKNEENRKHLETNHGSGTLTGKMYFPEKYPKPGDDI
ncbi:MAG: hypothetical protein H6550_07525 [Chitinophagales bacterium]|nr:hypothetical protein [Chitinophagales bacterium]